MGRFLYPVLLLVLCSALTSGLAGGTTGPSPRYVRGVVVGLPYVPPCFPDEPCDQPARPVVAFARAGKTTRVPIGPGGSFATELEPGLYRLRLLPVQAGRKIRPTTVRVKSTGASRITIRIVRSTSSTAAPSGIRGTVIKSPTAPVCREGLPCSAPAAGVALVALRGGVAVATVKTSAAGTYRFALPPGFYVIRSVRKSMLGSIPPRGVRVRPARLTVANLQLDTGIR